MPLHPTVLWAQRADVLYLTVEISDIKVSYCCCCSYIVFLMAYTLNFLQEHKIDLTETKLKFTGVGEKEQNQYEAEIEFYGNVDVEVSYSTLH